MTSPNSPDNLLLIPIVSSRGVWVPTGYHLILLQAILQPVIVEGRPHSASWPVWDYVVRRLRANPTFMDGRQAPEKLFLELPRFQNGTRQGYGLTWRSEAVGGPLQPRERVGLTVAGLRLADPLGTDALVRLAASFADDERKLTSTPDTVVEGTAGLNSRAERMLANRYLRDGCTFLTVRAAAEVLQHEHPPLVSEAAPGRWVANLGIANYAELSGTTTTEQYLDKIWSGIAPMNRELINTVQILRSHQKSVVIVHAAGTAEETRRTTRAVIQAAKGFFDVKTQVYEGDIIEVDDPRGFVDRRTVAKVDVHDGSAALAHLEVEWGPAVPTPASPKAAPATGSTEPQVFLVHGRDDGTKATIARFLDRALPGLDGVTILHEKPNGGRTILEKFEHHAGQSNYAVVLLTPDDEGGPKAGETQPRARQNVIFELGYFAGAIGRNRVMVINAGVEKPSDIDGLVYIGYPDGNWQSEVIRELRHAGFDAQLS